MSILVIVRHGQSAWNLENRFTGWIDVDITQKGEEEAKRAGEKIKNIRFDKAYTSSLKRAQRTLEIALQISGQTGIQVVKNQALNERHYGDLQGANKSETAARYGDEQVRIWRRSYDVAPPNGESLKDTAARVIPYFENEILPELRAGKNILISAHGNSLRALIMYLEKLTPEEILKTEIPTGEPRLYELDDKLNVTTCRYL